ncbi:MAG TPA: SDR family oxidoreductase [Marmoricola sp.]|jgi:NAD(P)-dependent dehydrogenase (short-subunit alcohol dehydrogenase family)|nr:SDR family oxidoreductase [Marmoricola sp.]
MSGLLEGQVALVSGSSRGIGRAVALSLAAHGASVVVNGRDAAACRATAAEINATRTAAAADVAGSVTDPGTAAGMVAAGSVLGQITIAINCAGTPEPPGSSILSISAEEWAGLVESHLTSSFALARAVAPGMVERGRGSIVLTGSHAFTGIYGGTGYAAAKGGVNSLTYALAAELREHGVRVNAVCPGARTRLSTGSEFEEGIARLHARGLLGDSARDASLAPAPAEHVAELYVFLASDLAAEITGQVLAGAGGYLGRFARPREQLLAYRDHADSPPWSPEEIAGFLG